MIKVLIADDHAILRKGMIMILSETEDIVVAGEASDGSEALDKVKNDHFDVMVLDLAMPKKGGIEVLRELRAGGNKIPILILSTYAAEEWSEPAIKEGASAYLTKEEAPEKLIDAIREVSQKKAV